MMTVHPLHAGDGYTYLTREVAAGDAKVERGQNLTDYYTAEGTPPGMWGGSMATELGVSGQVREDQMKALFGEGLHPDAVKLTQQLIRDGATADAAIDSVRLGRRFAMYRNDVALMKRIRAEVEHDRKATGTTLTASQCLQIQYRLAATEFHREVGRSPATEAELVRYLASQKRRERQPVAGYDCVFTPQKSVSVLWGLGDHDVRRAIEQAHHDAVSDAMGWVQDNASYTRVGKAGVGQIEAKGLSWARFDHRDNRNGDPNLHTHVTVSTKVQGVDGKWRSLDGRILHKLAVAASERYNTAVEENVTRALGVVFSNRPDSRADKRPVREIDGIPTELLREFSRRTVIERRLETLAAEYRKAHGKDPSRAVQMRLADQATLETRAGKPPPKSLAAQRTEWRQRAVALIGERRLNAALCAAVGRDAQPIDGTDINVHEAAHAVVHRVSRERATWTRWHVEAQVQRHLRGHVFPSPHDRDAVTERVIEAALGAHSIRLTRQVDAAPVALQRSDGASIMTVHGNETYTSQAMLDAEHRLVGAARTPTAVMATHESMHAALAAHVHRTGWDLGADKQALVEHFLFSGTLLAAGVGPAGTGKTTAMRVVVDAWRGTGYDVIALGPSAKAAGVLGDELGVEGRTIADVLTRHTNGLDTGITSGALILVDEAGMASTHDLDHLTAAAAEGGAVVRLLGDPQQLAAVDTGGALRLIARESGAPELVEVHRFRDTEEAEISLRLRDGDSSVAAWYAAKDRVRFGMADDLAEKVFAAWCGDADANTTSLMIASSNDTVRGLNDRARTDRIAKGLVSRGGHELSDGLRASAGDRIVTRRNDSDLRVTGTQGERVRNGDLWTVETVHRDGSMSVRHVDHDGRIRLPADYVRTHCELGYATTIHRSQGMTVDTAHVLVDDGMNRQALYVGLTRGRGSNNIYVPVDRIVDPHLIHVHPDKKIADEVVRTVIARDGSDTSATEQQQEAAVAHRKLDYNVAGYGYAEDLIDSHRIEAIVREQMGPERATQMIGEAEWDSFVRQFRRTEQLGLDAVPTLAAARSERELGSADSLSSVMHWRLQRRIDAGAEEMAAWRQRLESTMQERFGVHAQTILADERSWERLAVHLRGVERSGKDPRAAIAQLRRSVSEPEPTAGDLLADAERRWPLGRDARNPSAPSWILPPMQGRDGVDPELTAWSRRRYTEIADRTRELGQHAVDDQPDWTRHLGPIPESPADKLAWQLTAGQVGAYREQFGIDTGRTLIGDRPEHGDAAAAWIQVNARINALTVRDTVPAGHGAQTSPMPAVDPAVISDRARRDAAEQRAHEQHRLTEQRKAERREQLRRDHARRLGPGPRPRI
ncbi:relaxase domain-containing protein [Rhodococcus sp. BP-252]|uniref:MobF family relaxase n=1 Tax=unclassified Rhodococcus (in: high G+C Gram-positive bacteria) TaxID=192944 RepID=UPI001C9BA357|nr:MULTISPECIES: MobF family relaxase [unclassified Rhodococcus (in: high G+C Gram-positive bacteria)]MBY6412878.1 relaxase domain-containing protein [Rhodococcus sp. BP-320]MBY6417585.1 relaxase domain-containing protein [Rhodococcus sp. BP-321]MBY6423043.1 relaxase domain-containing protein [Rhodococcus sp. BP-324]MBY6427609.1 relaxase domain-containing protein [Rhodococcus sp. BP-323]MBY6432773.1 relaxase domain-containing protein [Rhodococcus sp. BP-322]